MAMNINIDNFKDDGWHWKTAYGYPQDDFYTNENTRFYQCFDQAPESIIQYAEEKFLHHSLTMMKQPPGSFIPNHTDKYYLFKKKYDIKSEQQIVRYCVFLEDWQPGHYFEVEGKPLLNWQSGDVCVLEKDVPHRSANAGMNYKYTAQITGVLK